jgi:hypothetical protein
MSSFPQADWKQYETGQEVEVSWNASDATTFACNDVTVNGSSCSSCAICEFVFIASDGNSTVVFEKFMLSADCTNLPNGRNAVCEDFTPVFYPLLVRNFETMCANNGGREFLTLAMCSYRRILQILPLTRRTSSKLIRLFSVIILMEFAHTGSTQHLFLFVPAAVVPSLELGT